MHHESTTHDGMRRYAFTRLHIPTGETSAGVFDAPTEAEAYKQLARWNAQQPGVWQYW